MTLFDSIIVIVEHLFLALASILLLTAGIAIAISLLVFFLELPDNIKKWLEKRKSDPDEEDEEISTVFIHKPLSNETRPGLS